MVKREKTGNGRKNVEKSRLPPCTPPPLQPQRMCVAGCKLKMTPRPPPRAHSPSYTRVQSPGLVVAVGPRTPHGAPPHPGPPSLRGLRSSSPPSLLLRLLLADSSRRIFHVNNIQALFTVAAGRRGTHASTLEEGGGGGKASAQHLHTHPAPPLRAAPPPRGRIGAPGATRARVQPAPHTQPRARGQPRKRPGARPPPPTHPAGKTHTQQQTQPGNTRSKSVRECGAPGPPHATAPASAAYPEAANCLRSPEAVKAGAQRRAAARPRPPPPPRPPSARPPRGRPAGRAPRLRVRVRARRGQPRNPRQHGSRSRRFPRPRPAPARRHTEPGAPRPELRGGARARTRT